MGLTLVDTGVIVGFLDADDALHGPAHEAFETRMRAGAFFCASAVTYAELLTGVELGHHDATVVHGFLDGLSIGVLPVDDAVAEEAARIRGGQRDGRSRSRRARLQMPDALILATAATVPGVDEVVVADRDWVGIDVGVDIHHLRPPAS
ncbi:MAG TPA: PIN domain-containing protein [Baekduia sp.]|nr:PIN domain-containing protein [Baekduia sp.]